MAVAASGIENRGRTKNNRDALSDVIRCGSRAASRYISRASKPEADPSLPSCLRNMLARSVLLSSDGHVEDIQAGLQQAAFTALLQGNFFSSQ